MLARLQSTRALVLLSIGFVALVAAFNVIPAAVSSVAIDGVDGQVMTPRAVADGLVELWGSGQSSLPASLQRLADYSRVWHATKIVICVLMLTTLVLLTVGLWRRYLDARVGVRRWGVAAGVSSVLTALASILLTVNVQATAAPSIALLTLVPDDASGALGSTLAGIVRGVNQPDSPDASNPALDLLRGNVEVYHGALLAIALVLGAFAFGVSVGAWRWWRAADTRQIRTAALTIGVTSAVMAALFVVLAFNSVLSVIDPSSGLLAALGLG